MPDVRRETRLMHYGSIHTDTKAARVLAFLREHEGQWFGTWDLSLATQTPAPGTRVSEIRHQLTWPERVETQRRGNKWFYRYMSKVPDKTILCFEGEEIELESA